MAIVYCGGSICNNVYQDRIYGKGKRVANKCNSGYRCVVCLSIADESKIDKSFVVEEE